MSGGDLSDSKSRAKERGGLSPFQGMILRMFVEMEEIISTQDHEISTIFSIQ